MLYKLYVMRKEAKLEQKDVAQEIGMHAVTYGRKERGVNEFTLTEALKLARLFDTSVDVLFGELLEKEGGKQNV